MYKVETAVLAGWPYCVRVSLEASFKRHFTVVMVLWRFPAPTSVARAGQVSLSGIRQTSGENFLSGTGWQAESGETGPSPN